MQQALEHRFQAALAAALWGYTPNGVSPSLPPPAATWASLVTSNPDIAVLASQQATTPLHLTMALLPMLLRYSDNELRLRRWLTPLIERASGTASMAIAVEGVYALRYLTDVIIQERSPMNTAALLPVVGPEFPHLSPYLSTVLSQRLHGAGLIQRLAAMAHLATPYSTEPGAHRAATALALALYSAAKIPDHSQLTSQRLFPLFPTERAGPTAAIAGFLCGLHHGLAGLSLGQYCLLETMRIPAASSDPGVSMSLPQLSQMLAARWAGALQPQIGTAAIAPPR